MNRDSQNQTPQRQQSGMSNQHRHSGSFGGTEIPASGGPGFYGNGRERGGGSQTFDLARSPPNVSNKNTKHVPCKFFRQGACQAGAACPFSHSMDPMMHQAPCKYFMKGNCKFGAKCALAHYLPNGHRVSRADLDPGMRSGFNMNRGGGEPPSYSAQDPNFNDPYLQQPYPNPEFFPGQDLPFLDDEQDAYNDRYNQYQTSANYDSGVGSPPTSQFGSPPGEGILHKQGAGNMRSALDAPLPASFDANSLPHIAKFGPFGQSVPDKFGLRSPQSSSISRGIKLGSPPENSNVNRLSSIGSTLRNVSSPLSMSPQVAEDQTIQKTMHSQKQTKPRMISASVPRAGLQGWGNDEIGAEADLLPSSLHDDVMLPQEKIRRLSRPDQPLSSSAREGSDGLNIPSRSTNNVGSPPTGSSPSRFRAFFDEQRKKDDLLSTNNPFGHVGSPLRESWMPHDTSEKPRTTQISGISQAMQRMELNRTDSTETNGSSRPLSGLRSNSGFGRFDRTISSPGLTGRKIDEDPGEGGFFEMDDESSKRNSGHFSQGSAASRERFSENQRPEASKPFGGRNGVRPIFGFGQPQ